MTRTRKKADADGPTNLNGKVQPDARMIVLATGSTVDAAADPVVDATHGASAVDQETEPVAGSVARAMVVDHPLSPPAADAYGLSDPPGPSDLGGPADLFDPGDADDPGDAGDALAAEFGVPLVARIPFNPTGCSTLPVDDLRGLTDLLHPGAP